MPGLVSFEMDGTKDQFTHVWPLLLFTLSYGFINTNRTPVTFVLAQ